MLYNVNVGINIPIKDKHIDVLIGIDLSIKIYPDPLWIEVEKQRIEKTNKK